MKYAQRRSDKSSGYRCMLYCYAINNYSSGGVAQTHRRICISCRLGFFSSLHHHEQRLHITRTASTLAFDCASSTRNLRRLRHPARRAHRKAFCASAIECFSPPLITVHFEAGDKSINKLPRAEHSQCRNADYHEQNGEAKKMHASPKLNYLSSQHTAN